MAQTKWVACSPIKMYYTTVLYTLTQDYPTLHSLSHQSSMPSGKEFKPNVITCFHFTTRRSFEALSSQWSSTGIIGFLNISSLLFPQDCTRHSIHDLSHKSRSSPHLWTLGPPATLKCKLRRSRIEFLSRPTRGLTTGDSYAGVSCLVRASVQCA